MGACPDDMYPPCPPSLAGMKALLEVAGRSPGGTRRRWRTAGEGHPTVPGQLAGCWPGEPGRRLVAGRFRLRSLLGRGGMGRVWLADDELLDRPVAAKQLLLYGLEWRGRYHGPFGQKKDGLSSSLRCRGVVDRQDDLHDGTRPGRAVQPDPAAERLDPILEPDQARAVAEIRAATPVVADTHLQDAVACGHLDLGGGGVRVLGRVGQRLGDHVVGGGLNRLGQPPRHLDVHADRDGRAAGQHPQRRAQPALAEDRSSSSTPVTSVTTPSSR